MTKCSRMVLGMAAALALVVGAARAAPIYTSGSFAFSVFTSTSGDVTTTKDYTASTMLVNPTGSGSMGMVSLPVFLSIGNPVNFSSTSGFNFNDPGLGMFTATSAMLTGTTDDNEGLSNESASSTWYVTGSFKLGSDWANAGTMLTASETWTLNQTGGDSAAISMGGTFASPAVSPPPAVPEPATLLVFGSVLGGIGVLRRRRKNKS